MSSQIPPDPITSNYNPTAWSIPELTEEERIALDKSYITFPIAQNKPITFPSAITIPTPAPESNTTLATTTAWVRTFWASVLAAANSWSGLQTFSSGIVANTINPTSGGTLLIGHGSTTTNVEVASVAGRSVVLHLGDGNNTTSTGAIHIGNGAGSANNVNILNGAGSTGTITLGSSTSTTSLGCPLTPAYTYPIAAGKIGEAITGTNTTFNLAVNTPKTVSSMSLTTGIWIINGLLTGYANSTYLTIAITTTTNSISSGLIAINTQSVQGTGPANIVTFIVSPTTTTTYYFVAAAGTANSVSGVVFTARRIA